MDDDQRRSRVLLNTALKKVVKINFTEQSGLNDEVGVRLNDLKNQAVAIFNI